MRFKKFPVIIYRTNLFLLGSLVLTSCQNRLDYPETKTVDQVDLLHGLSVSDPYRWLEDSESEETRKWIEAQNRFSFACLSQLERRDEINSRLTTLWDYEKFGTPLKTRDRLIYSYNTGLQNQSVLFWQEGLDGEPTELLDPNTLSSDGTVALTSYEISPSGKLMAYGTAEAGSDWQEWRLLDIETGEAQTDQIKWIKFSNVSWTADSEGFFYCGYDEPQSSEVLTASNLNQKVFYHRIGTPQSEDELIYERTDRDDWLFETQVTDDGRYLIITVRQGSSSENGVFYKDLLDSGGVVEFLNQFDARYALIGNQGSQVWFRTDLDAPLSRVIEIDLEDPARDKWETIIPESTDALQSVSALDNRLVCSYLRDASSQVKIFDVHGEFIRNLELPGIGEASGFSGRQEDKETFYSYESYSSPSSIYHYSVESGESTLFRKPRIAFEPSDFETRQVFYSSTDGTRVPMFISYKKGLDLNGETPTLLYGYGGFNIALTPSFSVTNLVWMEKGGIYAVANLRGGSEYGEAWHKGGMKFNKQNVFDDFIAAAEWLIDNGYTSSSHLAIDGASNGGLLVGACMTQRPDLFGAAIPRVGVMDMLRFHKFTIGWAWVSDYGSPDNPEEFKALHAYSPYHNIREDTEYPATLIMTADHDDRVVPAHSFKFVARLQQAQAGPEPILIRIETRAGHGSGKPTSKRIDESTDKICFLLAEIG